MKAPRLLRRRRPFLAPFWLVGFVALASVALLWGVLRATIAFAGETTTVIVLRHAEKAAVPADDPPLTPAGEARAERLRALLIGNPVLAVYASEARRTQDTARPLASALSLPVTVHPARDPQGLLDAIGARHVGGTVVVVGHSNTVPDIVSRLTRGKARVALRDDEFDRIFVVTVTRFGPPGVVSLRY
jgi:broad specificity phosphatase PhoE